MPSPGGQLVAVSTLAGIVVVDRSGGAPRSLDLAGTALERGYAIGWNPAGDALLLFRPRLRDDHEAVLGAYELRSGSVRSIFRSAEPFFPRRAYESLSSRASILLEVAGVEEYRLAEVDLEDGAERTIARSPCPLTATSTEDERLLAYGTCDGPHAKPPRSEIHLFDRRSGEDRIVGSVDGMARELFVSPAADRVLLARFDSDGVHAAIVGGGTIPVNIDGHWEPLGWTGKDQVVLFGRWQEPTPLVVASADGKQLRSLLP